MADKKIVHTKALAELVKDTPAKIGDVFYQYSYGRFIVVSRVTMSEYQADVLVVHFKIYKNGKYTGKEEHCDLSDLYDRHSDYSLQLPVEDNQTPEEAIKACQDELLEAFNNPGKYLDMLKDLEESEQNGMIPVNQKSFYETTQSLLDIQSKRVAILHKLIEQRMDALSNVFHKLQEQITKVTRIIGAIELYLGVNEEIVQIQEGTPAPIDTQISLRQMILYMDEEAAILDRGGIDWTRVEEFDEWLHDKSHLDRIFPEPKGIVVLRASRQDKYNTDNSFYNSSMKDKNLYTYLLIRNGDNLYRVYTNIKMGERFFPTLEESAHIEKLFEEGAKSGYMDDRAEDEKFVAVRNTLLVQGLIDRTEIFLPLAHRIDFFSPETYAPGGVINMIRDDELTLPSGKLSFSDWKNKVNSKIDRGSRIFLTDPPYWEYYGSKGECNSNRFTVYQNWYPATPTSGLYTVEEMMEGEKGSTNKFRILYLPNTYVNYYEQRKRRMSFLLYKDDHTVLNYDMISLDDLNYYIENRTDRHNFLTMLPVLIGLKKMRLQEIEDEKKFVTLISNKYGFKEKAVWKAINWWKYKVIWKRPIRKDDAKAWRMISKKLSGKEEVYFPEE
jgi:hypothetical protein